MIGQSHFPSWMKKKTVSGATYYFCYVCKYRVRRALIINNKRPDLVWSMLRIVGSTNMEVSNPLDSRFLSWCHCLPCPPGASCSSLSFSSISVYEGMSGINQSIHSQSQKYCSSLKNQTIPWGSPDLKSSI